ncbi:MAG: hypothetical protein H3C50_02910 [Kiritimatiellae bacterium]|nr:hypothetical protein [Kiritimatiellia bacterium]
MKLRWMASCVGALLAVVGCSTVTPIPGDAAMRSPRFGQMTKADAVGVMRAQARPASGMTDYGSFAMDEEGFSFKRTTQNTRSEYRDGRNVTVTQTVWITRNVPWNSISRTTAYFRDYEFLFTDEYRVNLTYEMTDFDGKRRVKADEEFDFVCRTEPDVIDVLAAIKALQGE